MADIIAGQPGRTGHPSYRGVSVSVRGTGPDMSGFVRVCPAVFLLTEKEARPFAWSRRLTSLPVSLDAGATDRTPVAPIAISWLFTVLNGDSLLLFVI